MERIPNMGTESVLLV